MAASDSWQRFERCRQHQPLPFPLYTLQSSLRGEPHKPQQSERGRVFVLQGSKEKDEALFVSLGVSRSWIGWIFLGVLLTAAVMIRYANFQQQSHWPQAQAPQDEQVDVPTFVTREQLPDIRIQLAHLNREFDDSDYDALRALDEDINPNAFALTEEEINAIPIYKYQLQSHPHSQKAEDSFKIEGSKFEENELTCSICMEQVNEEELIRRLPCSHEFHASCIFPWLRQHGTCPICKCRAG